VESIDPDDLDPFGLTIRLAPVPGLASPSIKIARDQLESFLAILGVEKRDELIGLSVRVTVDDEEGSERIAFLARTDRAEANEAGALSALEPAEPAAAEPAEPAEPAAAAQVSAPLGPAEPAEPAEPDFSAGGVPVMAGPAPADEITVYDGVGEGWTVPAASGDECVEGGVALTAAEQAIEDQARGDLAAAATAPLDRRYFLYRETYGPRPRPSVVELTFEEFALLGRSGAFLHVDDCTVIRAQDLSPDTVRGMERLLERTTSRPDAGLPRAEVERLAATGHVISCAVY
jgi:hypothetical protein